MNILKKFCLIGLCAFSVIFCEAIIPMQPAYAYQENISRGYELIEETWQGRDGSIMSITDRDFGEAPYSVRSVSNDGNYTVVTISVNGGRSINTLTFDNNNPNYMMLKYLNSRKIKFNFIVDNNLREINIHDEKMIFIYTYCLSCMELKELLPEENSIIVNLHNWNGEGCISKEACNLAKLMNIKLLTIEDFYGYINEIRSKR